MHTKVYLAGPISGLPYAEAVGWRGRVAEALRHRPIALLDPMRGKHALAGEGVLDPQGYPVARDASLGAQEIFRRDHFDVHRADVILAHLAGATRVSQFTLMELAWAYQAGKFCLVTLEKGGVHDHLCVRQAASLVVADLDAAVRYLRENF